MSRYKKILDPADDWPVFPMFHLPTLYEALRAGLQNEHDWSTDEIEAAVDDLTGQPEVFDALHEYELFC